MRSTVMFFGEHLVARGLVPAAAVAEVAAHQAAVNLPLGALALQRGLLSEQQVLAIHTEQKRTDRRFGELAVDLAFLTRAQVDALLAEQREAHVLLGEALVARGHLSRDDLAAAFAAYGAEQAAAASAVRRALAATPRPELVQIAADSTCRMLLRMGRVVAKVAALASEDALSLGDHVLIQRVEGERGFALLLALPGGEALGIARSMLEPLTGPDELPSSVDGLVLDVNKELVNLIVAQVCSRLGHGLEPATPAADARAPAPAPGLERVVVELALPRARAALALDV